MGNGEKKAMHRVSEGRFTMPHCTGISVLLTKSSLSRHMLFVTVVSVTEWCYMMLQASSRLLLLLPSCRSLPRITSHNRLIQRSMADYHSSPILSRSNFPPGILFAFAYGSAAFPQQHLNLIRDDTSRRQSPAPPSEGPEKMLDVVLVVKDSSTWHQANLSNNPSHYSLLLRVSGHEVIHWMQRKLKAHIYYNVITDVTSICPQSSCTSLKYGVIEYEDLVKDLTTWNCLYVSGRMHKPIHVLFEDEKSGELVSHLSHALKANQTAAVAASLLILMRGAFEVMTMDEILSTIAGLSYSGDFRMIIGEDKSKVHKIVASQKDLLKGIYLPILKSILKSETYKYIPETEELTIYFSDAFVVRLISMMPSTLKQSFGGMEEWSMSLFGTKTKLMEERRLSLSLAQKQLMSFTLKRCISSIVRKSSISQSVKGFFSVGFVNAINYAFNKMSKMFSSMSS